MGSCDTRNSSNCTACRTLSVGTLGLNCVEKCPDHLFTYESRRCVTDKECWNISKPFATVGDNVPQNPYIPFNGICSWTCPETYQPDGPNGARYCHSCGGECKKECHGGTIDSISGAQNYRGCAKITGTLILNIRQGGRKLRIYNRT